METVTEVMEVSRPQIIPEVLDVLSSKRYVSPNGNIVHQTPEHYLNPFLEQLQNYGLATDITVQTQGKVINQNQDGTENIAYPRVLVQARYSDGMTLGFKSTIGLIYALNLQRPLIKVFAGEEVSACTNLCIFGNAEISEHTLLNGYERVYEDAERMINSIDARRQKYLEVYERMQEQVSENETMQIFGNMLKKVVAGDSKLGTSPVTNGMKNLYTPGTNYYVRANGNNEYSNTYWNIYNAVTQVLTDQSATNVLEKPTKTLELTKLILN